VIGKVVKSEDIPAATQLFTPNWIVKYMVQNSLGAQWLATYPSSALKGQMEYNIEPAEQTDEVKAQLAAITAESLNPEELTLIDPACGSGHILVEAYELFKAIYLERGYQQREIPQLILEKNLFGLDIDERAAQLTSFALMMKGRGDDRRLFERGIRLNVMALVNSDGLDVEGLANAVDLADHGLKLADLVELKQLFEHATTFGSLIQVPDGLAQKLPALKQVSEEASGDMIVSEALKCLGPLVRQAELLAAQYDSVVANPPYMGGKYMNSEVRKFAKERFPRSKSDLFSVSTERLLALAKPNGFIGLMTPFTWMFLKSYEDLRLQIINSKTLTSLIQPEYHAIWSSAAVPICTFTLRNIYTSGYKGTFVRLTDFYGESVQPEKALEAIGDPQCSWKHKCLNDDFRKIPGSPIAYWISENVRELFDSGIPLGSIASPRTGCSTSNNSRFLRFWPEVCRSKVGLCLDSYAPEYRWYPYNKGGGFLKWYGHNSFVVDWLDEGREIRDIPTAVIANEAFFFSPGLTWGNVTSSRFSLRWFGQGYIFDNAGGCMFGAEQSRLYILSVLNSCVFSEITGSTNPTLHFHSGEIAKFPLVIDAEVASVVDVNTSSLVSLAKADWDSHETSWDFARLPIIEQSKTLPESLKTTHSGFVGDCREAISRAQRMEEENNLNFINLYGLSGQLSPDVPLEQITLSVNPVYRYGSDIEEPEAWNRFQADTMKELLSYAIGCMMGRYGLDQPGLILADSRASQVEQLAAYEEIVGKPLSEVRFKPDRDGIIPVLDGEWFEDDIVARSREFLRVCFPASSLNRRSSSWWMENISSCSPISSDWVSFIATTPMLRSGCSSSCCSTTSHTCFTSGRFTPFV